MATALVVAGFVSGILTIAFVLAEVNALRRGAGRSERARRGAVTALALGAFTALLALVQVVLLVPQWPWR